MILVTVGTHNKGFDRLIKPMDELCRTLNDHMLMQIGASNHEPQYAEFFRFTSSDHMQELSQQANIIVMHAGVGSIIMSLRAEKPIVLVPRLKRFGEVVDDHQLQIAYELEKHGKAVCVATPTVETLRDALNKAAKQKYKLAGAAQLTSALRQEIRR